MELQSDSDLARVREEFQRLIRDYDHEAFLSNCRTRSRGLIETIPEGAQFVAEAALNALASSKPLMMVRMGDGEANLLRFAEHDDDFELKWVDAIFQMMDGQSLPVDDARQIAREMSELLAEADIIGLRSICPIPLDQHFLRLSETIDRGNIRGGLGMIEAFNHPDREVGNNKFRHAVLTSAWVHLGLLEHLDRLLDNAPKVIVVSGRGELEKLFADKLGNRLAAFLPIPVQASDQNSAERASHYPVRYREIIAELRKDLRGTLVLVGAGILGKKYCAIAKQNGGVALDLGSAFDILAGKRTRYVHGDANFFDVNRETWITLPAKTSVARPRGAIGRQLDRIVNRFGKLAPKRSR